MGTCPVLTLHLVIKSSTQMPCICPFPSSLCHNTLCVHTDVKINTCPFHRRVVPAFGTVFMSLWRESNVLDNWQLTMLPMSELCEFNPRNLSTSLWIIGRFPLPEKKQHTWILMYVCVRACMCTCIYACLHVCLHARVSVRTHASTVVLSNIYGEANNIWHKYVICKDTIHNQR